MSNYDRFPEHQKLIVGNKKKKEKKPEKRVSKVKKERLSHHKLSNDAKVFCKFQNYMRQIILLCIKNNYSFLVIVCTKSSKMCISIIE